MVGAARDVETSAGLHGSLGSHVGQIVHHRRTAVNTASEQQQRCEMRRTEITAQEFFDRANEMAREDRSYEPGSKIVPTADGYQLVGSWMGTETLIRAIHGLYQNCFVKGRD